MESSEGCRAEEWRYEFTRLSRYSQVQQPGSVRNAIMAIVELAKSNPKGVEEDALAQLETVRAETTEWLSKVVSGEETLLSRCGG